MFGCTEKHILSWDINTGNYHIFIAANSQIFSMALSPNGTILAFGCGDGTVSLWDVNTGKCVKSSQKIAVR
ncbi:MAG: hypothetical protein HC907_37270 [Richelia sp. SM1_7_0]|nr:hypothetical protein [Richelia sp. SM1_7_0]